MITAQAHAVAGMKLGAALAYAITSTGTNTITVGAPIVSGATVTATVRKHGRADKVRIIKFRRRKHHKKQQGHRQHFTEVEITGINA